MTMNLMDEADSIYRAIFDKQQQQLPFSSSAAVADESDKENMASNEMIERKIFKNRQRIRRLVPPQADGGGRFGSIENIVRPDNRRASSQLATVESSSSSPRPLIIDLDASSDRDPNYNEYVWNDDLPPLSTEDSYLDRFWIDPSIINRSSAQLTLNQLNYDAEHRTLELEPFIPSPSDGYHFDLPTRDIEMEANAFTAMDFFHRITTPELTAFDDHVDWDAHPNWQSLLDDEQEKEENDLRDYRARMAEESALERKRKERDDRGWGETVADDRTTPPKRPRSEIVEKPKSKSNGFNNNDGGGDSRENRHRIVVVAAHSDQSTMTTRSRSKRKDTSKRSPPSKLIKIDQQRRRCSARTKTPAAAATNNDKDDELIFLGSSPISASSEASHPLPQPSLKRRKGRLTSYVLGHSDSDDEDWKAGGSSELSATSSALACSSSGSIRY